jgi:membrane-bound serine protease (ClpP class)
MKIWIALILCLSAVARSAQPVKPEAEGDFRKKKVYVVPVRDAIMPPMVYLVRRGVKEAMEAEADLLVIDMKTDGGRVDSTEEIIEILNKFKGESVTYVNDRAFSAGAFIAVATQKIYMAPQSVIGAAAPIVMMPGTGPEKMPDTYEVKMTSALSALVRTSAEKNGHNKAVVEKMIDKSKELKMDGEVINEKGQILTLTNLEAEKPYGTPPRSLLSAGTLASLDALLEKLGYADAERHFIKPTGAEQLATWLTAISPLLLLVGIIGIYIEMKTPGFGVAGIIGILALLLYFLGGYIAGLSGLEWVAVFLLGVGLVALELFVYPGTIALGLAGAAMMLAALIMAMVDVYPGAPPIPTLPQLRLPLQNILIAMAGGVVAILVLSRFLPKTPIYRLVVSQSASGVKTEAVQHEQRAALQGQIGVAISALRPGGKAQFGDQILDVISQGELVAKGTKVRIIGYSAKEALVEVVG